MAVFTSQAVGLRFTLICEAAPDRNFYGQSSGAIGHCFVFLYFITRWLDVLLCLTNIRVFARGCARKDLRCRMKYLQRATACVLVMLMLAAVVLPVLASSITFLRVIKLEQVKESHVLRMGIKASDDAGRGQRQAGGQAFHDVEPSRFVERHEGTTGGVGPGQLLGGQRLEGGAFSRVAGTASNPLLVQARQEVGAHDCFHGWSQAQLSQDAVEIGLGRRRGRPQAWAGRAGPCRSACGSARRAAPARPPYRW